MLSRRGKVAGIRNTCMKPANAHRGKSVRKKFITENFNDDEWIAFEGDNDLPENKSKQMHQYILQNIAGNDIQKQLKKVRVLRLIKYASAAVITIVAGIVFYFGSKPGTIQPDHKVTGIQEVKMPAAARWKEISNTESMVRHYRLPDSSLVTIYPKSTIRFEKLFSQKFRNVYLKGKAKFKVKRNINRPFSVYAGALKTTALGTSFTINTGGRSKSISVKLHTGKIVVTNIQVKQSPTYISTAGTTLLYNTESASTTLLKELKPIAKTPELLSRTGDLIIMKNIPLVKVIGLLNEAYHVQINSDPQQTDKITFTGTVNTKREKVEDVIRMICLINDMNLKKINDQEFNIEKSNK